MPLMQWDESLDIGVPDMNDDHRDILAAMNRIYDANGKGGHEINKLVQELADVCVRHFRDEEAYMERIGYPDLATHRMLHQRLLTRYGEHARQIREAGGVVDRDFLQFLSFWLTSHIKGVDVKYGNHATKFRGR